MAAEVFPGWYTLVDAVLDALDDYSFSDPIGATGQKFAAAKRYNTLNATDSTWPWKSLHETVANFNWSLGAPWTIMGIICIMAVACNLWKVINVACRKNTTGDASGLNMQLIEEMQTFKVHYRRILYVCFILAITAGAWQIFGTLYWTSTTVASYATTNVLMLALLASGLCMIVFSVSLLIRAATLAPERAEDAIVSPRVLDTVHKACCLIWALTAILDADSAGGTVESLRYWAAFLFAGLTIFPSLAYTLMPVHEKTPTHFVDHWVMVQTENVVFYTTLAVASFFMIVPIRSMTPQMYILDESNERYFVPFIVFVFVIPTGALLYIGIFGLTCWAKRKDKTRDMSVDDLSRMQDAEASAGHQALTSLGLAGAARGARPHGYALSSSYGPPKAKHKSSRSSTPTKTSRSTTPTKSRPETPKGSRSGRSETPKSSRSDRSETPKSRESRGSSPHTKRSTTPTKQHPQGTRKRKA
jgi:hypothetical protein